LARIEVAEGTPDPAVVRLEKIWRASPSMTMIAHDLATTLLAARRPQEALSVCRSLQTRFADQAWLKFLVTTVEAQMR
jgi:hypothetical protein